MLAETTPPDPWLIGALLGVAGFVSLLVRWMLAKHDATLQRQDKLHDENREEARRREERYQARADEQTEIHQTQVMTLQGIAASLSKIDTEMPRRVADEIEERDRDRNAPRRGNP